MVGRFEEISRETEKAKQRLTQRAPDGWESARFQAGFWLQVGSVKVALSPPAHPRVTLTVGRHVIK
jgi:hypothetical protein